jgi:hypothetical protein
MDVQMAPQRLILAFVFLFVWGLPEGLGGWLRPAQASLPGPAPQSRPVAIERAERRCVGCHREIAAEWQTSYHRRAYTDPAFQRSLAGEPQPFCRSCHAPEAEPSSAPAGWAAESGVACVSCHLEPDTSAAVLADPARLHQGLRKLAELGTDACAQCHEFQFPNSSARSRPEWMQSTVAEHAQSELARRSCVGCHMQRTGQDRHRSHRFLGGHDAGVIRRALRVEAAYAPGELRLRLIPQGVGHALPTGDLFRQLRVEVLPEAAGGALRPEQAAVLGRQFVMVRSPLGTGEPIQVERADTRLYGPRELRFPWERAAERMRWRVRYVRVLAPGVPHERGGWSAGELVVARGAVELPGPLHRFAESTR